MGFPWLVHIHAANIQDRDGVDLVVPVDVSTRLERLELILADGGYAGKAERRTKARTGIPLKIARRRGDNTTGEWTHVDGPPPSIPGGFQVIPQRWIVERSNAWFCRRRRQACDYERTVHSSRAFYSHAIGHILTARIPC